MARSATARVILDAKDRMSKKLDKASGNLGKFKRAITPVTAVIAGFTTASIAATKAAVSYGDEIAKAAKRAGLSSDVFQAWSLGVREAGGSTRDLEKAAIKLNQTIGDAQMGLTASVDAFQALGVEFEDTNGVARETDEVMRDVLDVLSQMPNKAQQALVAPDLLGRSWSSVVDITKDGAAGLRELEVRAAASGQIISATLLQDAEQASDELERFGGSVKNLSTSFFLQFAPALSAATNSLTQFSSELATASAVANRTQDLNELIGRYRELDNLLLTIDMAPNLGAQDDDIERMQRALGISENAAASIAAQLGDEEQQRAALNRVIAENNSAIRAAGVVTADNRQEVEALTEANRRLKAILDALPEAQAKEVQTPPGTGKSAKEKLAEVDQNIKLNALATVDDETRREYMIHNLRQRAEILKEAAAQEGLTKAAKLEADRAHALAEAQVEQAITDDKQKHTATRIALARQSIGQLKAFASLSDSENRKQFERNKKINIALGIADTWLAGIAVMKAAALTPGAAVPGYVQAQLALTVAAGLNAVNQIRKTSFTGGAGGAPGAGGAAAEPSAPGQLPANTGEPAQPLPTQSTTIYFSGKTADISEVRSLIETISDEAERNGGRVANLRVIGGN